MFYAGYFLVIMALIKRILIPYTKTLTKCFPQFVSKYVGQELQLNLILPFLEEE